MKSKIGIITEKIILLNETILDSMVQADDKAIIKNFTETGIKILEADFGFAWWKFSDKEDYKLAYKSPSTPYNPFLPRKNGGHSTAIRTKKPIFDTNVKKGNYGLSDISPYMKSYVIVPISHANYLYGGLTLCYKKQHNFTKEELTLAEAIGSATAQAITIHRLNENEKDRYKKEILLKKDGVLLRQEKLKMEFIANATHELRTPVAIMKGNVDLAMLRGGKSPKAALKAINYEIKHLSQILVDLSLITSNAWELKNRIFYEKVNLRSLITIAIGRCKALAYKKNISVSSSKIPDIYVLGDKGYLEKMLVNLLNNSIIYGKKGGFTKITIVKSKGFVVIKVTDNGIGISKKDLPHVFERFYRVNKFHRSGGTSIGLGLAIVKWIAEIHGGEVSVTSTESKGSVFSVTLPIKVT